MKDSLFKIKPILKMMYILELIQIHLYINLIIFRIQSIKMI